jgi:hypothetical protein
MRNWELGMRNWENVRKIMRNGWGLVLKCLRLDCALRDP